MGEPPLMCGKDGGPRCPVSLSLFQATMESS
ncbi:rCG62122, partial [Rattus norvegicus]